MRLQLLGIMLLTSSFANTVLAAPAEALWTTSQGNTAHTGYVDTNVDPAVIKIIWTKKIEGPKSKWSWVTLGHAAISDQAIYIRANTYISQSKTPDQLLAIKPENGETLWKINLPDNATASSPTYDNDRVYLQLEIGDPKSRLGQTISLQAYDANHGKLLFSSNATTSKHTSISSPIIDNHQLFIGTSFMQMSLNADDGRLQWKIGDVASNELEATITSKYVLRIMDRALAVLNRKNGNLITTIAGVENISSYSGNNIIWDEKQQTAYAIFSPRAEENQSQLTAFNAEQQFMKWKLLIKNWLSQPVLANNTLYFAAKKGAFSADNDILYAVNTLTGKIVWRWETPAKQYGNMIVTNNALIAHIDNTVYFISRDTHEVMAKINTPGIGTMAVADNVLYVLDDNGWDHTQDSMPAYVTAIALN